MPNRLLSLITCLFALASCCTPPTPEQVANADIGTMPSQDWAEQEARKLILARFERPDDTELTFHPPTRGWYRLSGFEGVKFGWKMRVDVVRPNLAGALQRPATWTVFFRDGRPIAFTRPLTDGREDQASATELLPDGRVRGASDGR